MPAWLLALLHKALELLVGLFVKKPPAPDLSHELGRAEQQNADMKVDTAVMRRATAAAKIASLDSMVEAAAARPAFRISATGSL